MPEGMPLDELALRMMMAAETTDLDAACCRGVLQVLGPSSVERSGWERWLAFGGRGTLPMSRWT
jgi:hypothetical protein